MELRLEKMQQLALFSTRVALGWVFFYAGGTKILNPDWSAAGYLQHAKTFTGFFQALLQPDILPFVNVLNEWGLFLLGVALLLGVFVRLGGVLGAVLMLLYYFPVLDFPYVGTASYIIDDHIIYAIALLLLAAFRAGDVWGVAPWCARLPLFTRHRRLRAWL